MSDSADNTRVDTFISMLKKMRMRDNESDRMKECIVAFTHANLVLDDCVTSCAKSAAIGAGNDSSLFAYEKALIFGSVASFIGDHPLRAQLAADNTEGEPIRIAMWHGTNLFRHVQPFFVTLGL